MSDSYTSGIQWDAAPKGREEHIANSKTYVTGSNEDRAIIIIHNVAGWTYKTLRRLADAFAAEVDATVYIPDFFKDAPFPSHELIGEHPTPGKPFDVMDFMQNNYAAVGQFALANTKDIRRDEIFAVAEAVKAKHKSVGVAGYCWGGWAAFQLGANDKGLVDCVYVAHPNNLTTEEVDTVGVPVLIHCPETSLDFTPELKRHCFETIPARGLAFGYQHFPGQEYSFATRGDACVPGEREAMVLAKNAAVMWFRNWLVVQ